MRAVLYRPFVAGALLAGALVSSGVASAETSASCPKTASYEIVSGANDSNRLWVYHVDGSSRTTVCLHIGTGAIGGLAIVVDTQSSLVPAIPTVGDDPNTCTFVVPGADLDQPVRFRLAINPSLNAVCITLAGSTTTVQFTVGVPAVQLPLLEVWRDGGVDWGLIDAAACPDGFVNQAVFHTPSGCMATNTRLFPPVIPPL
jgi:hypothetical protein